MAGFCRHDRLFLHFTCVFDIALATVENSLYIDNNGIKIPLLSENFPGGSGFHSLVDNHKG